MGSDSKRNLYLFSAFCAFGLVVCQTDVHLVCSPTLWISGEKAKLQCSVLKSSYPSKCVTSRSNTTVFRRSTDGNAYQDECILSDILGNCTSSGGCVCSPNTTHYIFEYEFTASTKVVGYWDCSVPCFDQFIPLTSSKYDCDNRKSFDKEFVSSVVGCIVWGSLASVVALIAVPSLVAIIWILCAVVITWVIFRQHPGNQMGILTSQATKDKIHTFIQENTTCCFRCCVVNAEVNVDSLESGEVLITLKSKLIWSFCLRDMPAKLKQFINEEFLQEKDSVQR